LELRYAAAGINQFLLNSKRILAPGLFLGICETETYELRRIALKTGDSICFLTDGISDIFDAENLWTKMRAENVCRLFQETDIAFQAKDDATAICITVKQEQ
jgi:serine phosphatase RsbU (regulator of sigma subunit)